MRQSAASEFPCRSKPQDQWCDRHGPAGFMGHTCIKAEPEPLTRDDLLVLLIEECGEVIQAATKALRFGWDVDHGVGYGNNRDQLAKEMGELTAVRDALDLDYGPCQTPFMNGWKDKIERATAAKAKYGRVDLVGQASTPGASSQPSKSAGGRTGGGE